MSIKKIRKILGIKCQKCIKRSNLSAKELLSKDIDGFYLYIKCDICDNIKRYKRN